MKLTQDQQDLKYSHELNQCFTCRYADQLAIKEHNQCCTFGRKLTIDKDGVCKTHRGTDE
jgi:hypothetical protein